MIELITNWFKEQNYNEGVELYKVHGSNPQIKLILQRGSIYSNKVLLYNELSKLQSMYSCNEPDFNLPKNYALMPITHDENRANRISKYTEMKDPIKLIRRMSTLRTYICKARKHITPINELTMNDKIDKWLIEINRIKKFLNEHQFNVI